MFTRKRQSGRRLPPARPAAAKVDRAVVDDPFADARRQERIEQRGNVVAGERRTGGAREVTSDAEDRGAPAMMSRSLAPRRATSMSSASSGFPLGTCAAGHGDRSPPSAAASVH